LALLAFCEFELYRTHVRRQVQIHKIFLRFSKSAQRVDFIDTLEGAVLKQLPFFCIIKARNADIQLLY